MSIKKIFILILFIALGNSPVLAKDHPYDGAFEAKVTRLFLGQDGQVSKSKVDAYSARLAQKKSEIVGILTRKYRSEGERDSKIAEKLKDHEVIYAFDRAISMVSALPLARGHEQFLDMAYDALDLEAAIRIEGNGTPLEQVKLVVRTLLDGWKIPKHSSPEDEASNLVDPKTGAFLSAEDIENLNRRGADLSLYDPDSHSTFWENPGDVSKVDMRASAQGKRTALYQGLDTSFPNENTFIFDGMKYTDTKPKMDVYVRDRHGKKQKFKLKVAAEIHADPTVSALMMTLGFPTDLTRYAQNIKVVLGKKTLSDLTRDWEVYYKRDNTRLQYKIEDYIQDSGVTPDGDHYVVFKEGLLEAKPDKIERLGPWSYGSNSHNSFREVRGLMFLQIWMDNTDVPEMNNNRLLLRETKSTDGETEYKKFHIISDAGKALGFIWGELPEKYSWDVVSKDNADSISLHYLSVPTEIKNKITWADARWATRLLAGLTREQITTAVNLGHWPQCVADIYVEKLISRRNDLVRHLGLLGERLENGDVIREIPLKGPRDQFKFNSLCDAAELKKTSTVNFDYDLGFLLAPVANATWKLILDQARHALNSMERIVIKSDDFKLDFGPVADIILSPRRDIEPNPNPTSDNDLYIVKDYLKVGFRYGVKYGLYADQIYSVAFTLTYPVRSIAEGRTHNDFLINALLPQDVIKNRLPEQYVLMTEHSVQADVGVHVSTHTVLSPELEASRGEVRLHRSILDHRDPEHYVLYRDHADFDTRLFEAGIRALIFRLPIYDSIKNWGQAVGKGFQFTGAEIQANPGLTGTILRSMAEGDFSTFRLREKDFYLTNQFRSSMKKWNLIFIGGDSERRLENITVTQDEDSRSLLQYRSRKSRSWNFLGNGETRRISVEVYAEPNAATADNYQLNLSVLGLDKNTRDKELSKNYLFFINGLSVSHQPVIPFSPDLGYSSNGKWGHLITSSETAYFQAGLRNIIQASDYDFWKALSDSLGKPYSDLRALYAKHLTYEALLKRRSDGATRSTLYRKAGLTHEENDLMEHAADFLAQMKVIRQEPILEKKVRLLAEAFKHAAYKHVAGFYEPRIVGALNRLAGAENFYSRNIITTPAFTEVNMIEETPLFGELGTPQPSANKYLVYAPMTALDLYYMFDSWF